jgi:NAD(P) transhydrogenase subunit alpha
MIAGVLRETLLGERRVAVIPASVPVFSKLGLELWVESGAGLAAGFPDAEYASKGARIVDSREELLESAQLLLSVRVFAAPSGAPGADRPPLRPNQTVIGLLDALGSPHGAVALAQTGATAFALELVPRITRAQNMDVLSSQATVVGYRAVLLAATQLARMFPMLMTAGGTLTPAKVLVIGVGVAGLQAIATARRLGAVVSAYDIRPAVKEQVESLGARFVELALETLDAQDEGGYAKAQGEEFYRKQRELLAATIAESDVVITTAAVPGRRAPVLVTQAMVEGMAPGAVIVDVAAEQGGNCEATRPGETVDVGGVFVLGPVNLASGVAAHASQMYAKNLSHFAALLIKDGALTVDEDDGIVVGTLVCRGGEVVHERVREALGVPPNDTGQP